MIKRMETIDSLLHDIDALIYEMERFRETDMLIWMLPAIIRASIPPRLEYRPRDKACNWK